MPRADHSGALSQASFAVDSAVVLLIGENNCAVEAYPASEAYLASKDSELTEGAKKLYLNDVYSESASLDDTCLVYSCPALSSSFAYETDVSGIIFEMLPSKEDPTSVVLNSGTYALAGSTKKLFKNESEFSKNDFVTLYLGKNGLVEYAEHADIYDTEIYEDNGLSYDALVAATLKGPEIVTDDGWKEKLGFDAESADYYIDGRKVDISTVRPFDVLYYSETFRTVWIYSDKVTGLVEAISPNTVAPSSVTVAGNVYPLESAKAVLSFGGKGVFAVGDTVTLLMGAVGVAAAVPPESASSEFLGISTAVEKKEYTAADRKTYEDYYVSIAAFDGKTYSIKTGDSDFDTGVLVYASFSDGEMNVKEFSVKYSSSDISALKTAIKNGKIAPDAVLVDHYGTNFVTTFPSRLAELDLTDKNVAYYRLDSDGNVDYLVLKDATGDCDSYGVILKFKGNYTFLTSSKNNSISNYISAPTGAVQVKYGKFEADKITALNSVDVMSIDGAQARSAAKSYPLWDYAECFVTEQSSFTVQKDSDDKLSEVITKTSVDYIKTLLSGNQYTIKGYYDSNGIMRVLVAQPKK